METENALDLHCRDYINLSFLYDFHSRTHSIYIHAFEIFPVPHVIIQGTIDINLMISCLWSDHEISINSALDYYMGTDRVVERSQIHLCR